ncbi:structural protein [Vibrio sp. V38_P2S17PM301]|nr:structural protein [Vibrio sp. V36_P2S2PM302]NAX28425.1 structural protein [Vibrio sp. V38_P2S17PM301]NAX29571.1 structural protein [Vibrio sp. V37_P2S8PM304]
MPRGIRNKNPGNIEDNGVAWRGRKGNDGRFIIFDSEVNGIRAIARILNTYRSKYGIDTIESIINRWAPPVENNTGAYIQHVAAQVGIAQNATVSKVHYPALIKAIIKHENGVQPYSDGVIHEGIAAA